MASTMSFPPLASRKIPFPIILAGSYISLGPHWSSFLSNYTGPLVKRLSEENYPHPLGQINLVAYSQVHAGLIDPVYPVVGHEAENIVTTRVITESSPDTAALYGYLSVIKIIEDLQTRHPNEFSFFLWHVVAGRHGCWDPNWEIVRDQLMKQHVNLSMVLLDDCPFFEYLFSAISPPSSRITPWFRTSPGHKFLISGFLPPGELGGAVPSLVSAAHLAPSIPVPSTSIGVSLVTPWDASSELPAHGTQFSGGQWTPPHFTPRAGPVFYSSVSPIVPILNACGGPLASPGSSAVVQSQPHTNLNNMPVPGAQGLALIDCLAPPHDGGVEKPQPTFLNYTGFRGDFAIEDADAIARPMSSISSDETVTSNDEWIGTLDLNGTRVLVRALMAEAIGDQKLSDLPNELGVEPAAAGTNISILDIQACICENKATVVRLVSCMDGKENSDFDWLVREIRAHSYGIVTWENRDRLLLAAFTSESLLCVVFPEKGTPKRPTPQQPQPVRKLNRPPRRRGSSQKEESSPKKGSSPKKERKNSRQKSSSWPYLPATSPKSSNDPCGGRYSEAASQSTTLTIVQQPQSEQPQIPYNPQVAMGYMRGEDNSSSQYQQMGGFAQPQIQMTSPPQSRVEQHVYSQAPLGMLGADGEPASYPCAHPPTNRMADPYNTNPEALEDSSLFGYVNFDRCGE